MSYSFVILDLKNTLNVNEIKNQIKEQYQKFEIVYCSSTHIEDSENISAFCFEQDEKIERVINAVMCKCTKQNIVLVRKFISVKELKVQTDALKSDNQIIYFKKPLSKFKTFFWKIMHKLAKLIFYKDLLLINNNQITYGKNASDVLKVLQAPSNAIRTFSWQGINFIPVSGGTEIKYNYNKTRNALFTFVPLLLSIVCLVLFFVLKSSLNAFSIMLLFATVIIGLILSGIFFIYWFIKARMGENILSKANIKIKGEKNE